MKKVYKMDEIQKMFKEKFDKIKPTLKIAFKEINKYRCPKCKWVFFAYGDKMKYGEFDPTVKCDINNGENCDNIGCYFIDEDEVLKND